MFFQLFQGRRALIHYYSDSVSSYYWVLGFYTNHPVYPQKIKSEFNVDHPSVGDQKFVRKICVTCPTWPPCMLSCSENLLQNLQADFDETL